MFELSVRSHFSGAHHLDGYPGKCAAQHGHNWEVEVFVRGEQLDETGILADFRHIKDAVENLLNKIDHSDLNTFKAFKEENPTSENIARFLYRELSAQLNCGMYRVHRVCVRETPGTGAAYWE